MREVNIHTFVLFKASSIIISIVVFVFSKGEGNKGFLIEDVWMPSDIQPGVLTCLQVPINKRVQCSSQVYFGMLHPTN